MIVPGRSQPLQTASGASANAIFSNDGRYIVFESTAHDLVAETVTGDFVNVFRYDSRNDLVSLISSSASGETGGRGNSFGSDVSTNSQFVAFISEADDLVPGDFNGAGDVFVRNVEQGMTELVSRAWDGDGSALGDPHLENIPLCSDVFLSGNGRYVVFSSRATNLVSATDGNSGSDIFHRDLLSGETVLVSGIPSGVSTGSRPSHSPSMSEDGRWVAFVSSAGDLASGPSGDVEEIFLWDRETKTTRWVSSLRFDDNRLLPANDPIVSSDGKFVIYRIGSESIWRYESALGTDIAAWRGRKMGVGDLPMRSTDDGRYATFLHIDETIWFGEPRYDDQAIYRVDFETLEFFEYEGCVGLADCPTLGHPHVDVVSAESGSSTPMEFGDSYFLGGMSSNGRHVYFFNAYLYPWYFTWQRDIQIFQRDLQTLETTWVSTNRAGAPDRGIVPFGMNVASDGTRIVYATRDASHVTHDGNDASDLYLRDLLSGELTLITKVHSNRVSLSESGQGFRSILAMDRNGERVAYMNRDQPWLAPMDTNNLVDLFVYDTRTRATRYLPSHSLLRGETNRWYTGAKWSSSGQFLIYTLEIGGGLDKVGDTAAIVDPFPPRRHYVGWWNLTSDRHVVMASEWWTSSKVPKSSMEAYEPSIHPNGLQLAFTTDFPAHEFSSVQDRIRSATPDIILWETFYQDWVIQRVISKSLNGTTTGNGPSIRPRFSPDGSWLVFLSQATDLTDDPVDAGRWNLFGTRLTFLGSYIENLGATRLLGAPNLGPSITNITFSGDSRYIAFELEQEREAYRRRLPEDDQAAMTSLELICTNCSGLRLSQDGDLAVYVDQDPNRSFRQVMLHDFTTGQKTLVSTAWDGKSPANGDSFQPMIDPAARHVVFVSLASNLVQGDLNSEEDIFLWVRATGTMMVLSQSMVDFGTASGRSFQPEMSADGRTVMFKSFASDLAHGDFNRAQDSILIRLTLDDLDEDGMEDDWEVAYFGNLERDGTGDWDGDGHTDGEEFLTGTNPLNDASILRVVRVESSSAQPSFKTDIRVTWASELGRTYRLQYKDELQDEDWQSFPFDHFATSSTSFIEMLYQSSTRYFRILLLP